MKIYIDGKYYEKENAKISVFDHGLLYGDGIFEGIRIYNGKIFKLKEHIDRLFRSAKSILLQIPMNQNELEKAIIETVKLNDKKDGYIRLVVTRGEGNLGIDPDKCEKASIIIIVSDLKMYPEEFYKNGIEIITSSTLRISPSAFDPRIKSLNYLNNILAKIEAKKAGVLECVMFNNDGYVVECTGDNIFIISNGKLLTPSSFIGALDGITKGTIIEISSLLDIQVKETLITKYDLYNADECFLTGTGAEVIPVIKIDGRIIGEGKPGKYTKQLLNEFRRVINE
jgi:branched-chain amino acid aminotransferase